MIMKQKKFLYCVFALLMIFAVSTLGGCGGGSGGGNSLSVGDNTSPQQNNEEQTSPILESESATRPETPMVISMGMDIDGNNVPDFLDFYGVPQLHLNNSVSSSRKVFAASSVLAAAEMNLTVPSMIWLDKLYKESEGANVFLVPLDAGTEYTFEFSKNFTDFLGGTLPNIKIYDPSNSILSLDVAESISDVEISAYPPEHPSIICYTFTPEISGNYIVKILNGETLEDVETDSVLFIYKERRNEKGENGYYTNFKFQDANGNKSESINIKDIIQLRKLFLEKNPTYFKEVYGHNSIDDEYGANPDTTSFKISDDKNGDYARFMDLVQYKVGLVPVIDPDADIDDGSGDGNDDEYGTAAPVGFTTNKVVASAQSRASAQFRASDSLDDEPAAIETTITGIPYEDRYELGKGFLAFTLMNPPGVGGVDISEPYEDIYGKNVYSKGAATFDAIEESMEPKASDNEYNAPTKTEFYAKFISTSSQADSLSQTSANVSVTTAAAGVSASTGSTNNFKFGLTSTTLVIHYEKTEIDYRKLTSKQLTQAWEDMGLFDYVAEMADGDEFLPEFRNDFGDYYVSGYQYGACFDAYISITTKTSEQIKSVEKKLAAEVTYNGVTGSGDVSQKTKDTLTENEAQINVRIVTCGMGGGPVELALTNSSNDVSAVNDVFGQLMNFHNALSTQTRSENFAPVRVRMTRWRNNLKLARIMKNKGDKTGKIPITVGKAVRIAELNTALSSLRAYRNVVVGNSGIDREVIDPLDEKYAPIMTRVTAANENLYENKYEADFNSVATQIKDLSPKYKALGDRYTFYTKLVIAQEKEKKTYDELKAKVDGAEEGSETAYESVRKMPFGESDFGGSSGYDQFAVSKYVTEDIDEGELVSRRYARNGVTAWRLEWSSTNQESVQKNGNDYLKDAGPAMLEAKTKDGSTARFCKVGVNSSGTDRKTDRHRELESGSSPAVGKQTVKFYFMSGYGDAVDWNIFGKSMRMRREDYPFDGLQ